MINEPVDKIFCYRDLLIYEDIEEEMDAEQDDERSEYKKRKAQRGGMPNFGVTLYFIEGLYKTKPGTGIVGIFQIVDIITPFLKTKNTFDVSRGVEKLLLTNNPIVQFVKMCIDAGTSKTQCYTDARAAGIAVRKQNQLALYEYLKEQTAPEPEPERTREPEPARVRIPPPYAFFETVRDFIRDELMNDEFFGQLEYIESDLSECDASDIESTGEFETGDFIFEMGQLETATLKYFGHYHRRKNKLVMRIYPEFDEDGLKSVLRR